MTLPAFEVMAKGWLPRARVIETHRPPRGDPLIVSTGTPLRLGDESVEYPGWIWATAPSGRSAWIPEPWVAPRSVRGFALRDYSSEELSINAGESAELVLEVHGWVWARARDGREGWLPLEKLEFPPASEE